jgi:hypothetical protein
MYVGRQMPLLRKDTTRNHNGQAPSAQGTPPPHRTVAIRIFATSHTAELAPRITRMGPGAVSNPRTAFGRFGLRQGRRSNKNFEEFNSACGSCRQKDNGEARYPRLHATFLGRRLPD